MKKVRFLILMGGTAIGLLLAGYLHFRLVQRTEVLRMTHREQAEKIAAQRHDLDELTKRVDAARTRYRSLLQETAGKELRGVVVKPTDPAPAAQPDALGARIAAVPALRQAAIQAYVDDRRLAFGGLLKRLGLSTAQIERFDGIQAEYQNRMLDLAATASEQRLAPNSPEIGAQRAEIRKWEDGAYRDLFDTAYPQWISEVSNLGSRQVVNSIVQSTFSGSGALAGPQADQLTALLDHHKSVENGRTQYDWEGIFRAATPLLSAEQLDGFKSGVEYYLANAQMTVIATNARK